MIIQSRARDNEAEHRTHNEILGVSGAPGNPAPPSPMQLICAADEGPGFIGSKGG